MQDFLNTSLVPWLMKKALAQNPNLLRTLIGMSLTLIFMLSYAVYGATVSPSVYIYQTEPHVSHVNSTQTDQSVQRMYDAEANITTWSWQIVANGTNLTWVNVTASALSSGSSLRVLNVASLYSHPLLGTVYDLDDPLREDFSCAIQCTLSEVHVRTSEEGENIYFHSLTSIDPARRSNGSVFATSISEAEIKARQEIEYTHSPSMIRIEIVEKGNRSTHPALIVETVNEAFADVSVFSVDTATEFLWALAAVVGCFSLVLIPSFTVYFAARAKERRDEAKLKLSIQSVEQEVLQQLSTDSEQ